MSKLDDLITKVEAKTTPKLTAPVDPMSTTPTYTPVTPPEPPTPEKEFE